jgi:hypothetical protein
MWLKMVWGSETKKKKLKKLFLGLPSAWHPVAGWQPSGAHWLGLAALQAVSISWKVLKNSTAIWILVFSLAGPSSTEFACRTILKNTLPKLSSVLNFGTPRGLQSVT